MPERRKAYQELDEGERAFVSRRGCLVLIADLLEANVLGHEDAKIKVGDQTIARYCLGFGGSNFLVVQYTTGRDGDERGQRLGSLGVITRESGRLNHQVAILEDIPFSPLQVDDASVERTQEIDLQTLQLIAEALEDVDFVEDEDTKILAYNLVATIAR